MAQNVYDEALKAAIGSPGVANLKLGKNAQELLAADSLINR